MKIHPVGAELFYVVDRLTDMTKLIVAFHSSANVPKMCNFVNFNAAYCINLLVLL